MTHTQGPGVDQEEPPLIQGLFLRGSRRLAHVVRHALAGIERGRLLRLWAGATLLVFLGAFLLGLSRSASLSGIASGIVAGLFSALLFAAGAAWLLMWGLSAPAQEFTFSERDAAAAEASLAPTLRELNAVRADVIRTIKRRSILRVPLATAGACLLWLPFFMLQWGDEPTGFVDLIVFALVGAIGGEAWAAGTLPEEYRRLYKARVLPHLAARFGGLTYRQGSADSVESLRAQRILNAFDTIVADDEIVGIHRGLPLSIVEVRLYRSGDPSELVFDGLLVDLVLPRNLAATTVIAADEGWLGNLATQMRSERLQRVRLEDPRFEARYQTYSTDQIEARALLTPAFMERFTALSGLSAFSLPGALAEGNRFMTALPKRARVDLFQPPPYWKPAGGQTLLTLSEDIAAVLAMADAVIDLDFWARGRTPHHQPATRSPL